MPWASEAVIQAFRPGLALSGFRVAMSFLGSDSGNYAWTGSLWLPRAQVAVEQAALEKTATDIRLEAKVPGSASGAAQLSDVKKEEAI